VAVLPLVTEFVVQSCVWASRLAVGGALAVFGFETTTTALVIVFLAASVTGVVLVQRSFRKSMS
jgi:hypothetical protein